MIIWFLFIKPDPNQIWQKLHFIRLSKKFYYEFHFIQSKKKSHEKNWHFKKKNFAKSPFLHSKWLITFYFKEKRRETFRLKSKLICCALFADDDTKLKFEFYCCRCSRLMAIFKRQRHTVMALRLGWIFYRHSGKQNGKMKEKKKKMLIASIIPSKRYCQTNFPALFVIGAQKSALYLTWCLNLSQAMTTVRFCFASHVNLFFNGHE